MTTFKKLIQKLESVKRVNNELSQIITKAGGGASGNTATMFMNASKDLVSIQNEIRKALTKGEISVDEYKSLMYA